MNLVVRDIKADGHCLYRSLEDQLALEHGAFLLVQEALCNTHLRLC